MVRRERFGARGIHIPNKIFPKNIPYSIGVFNEDHSVHHAMSRQIFWRSSLDSPPKLAMGVVRWPLVLVKIWYPKWLGLTEMVKSVKSKFCVVKCDELSQDFLVSTVQSLFFGRFRNPDECVASREHRGAVLRELALQHL